jgi:hypothetical protein
VEVRWQWTSPFADERLGDVAQLGGARIGLLSENDMREAERPGGEGGRLAKVCENT